MLNTKERFKQIEMDTVQQEPLFTDLTPEAAAIVEGGASFQAPVKFDSSLTTRRFSVRSGGNIYLVNDTQGGDDLYIKATVRNVNTGKKTSTKSVRGLVDGRGGVVEWTGMRGGTYVIDLSDTKDGKYVTGKIGVGYAA